ncbi:MAG: 16S rRNA methyltransferase [Candidatus Hermodarchaeota archaeon]
MPLTIILAECGLELIPEEIKSSPAIKKSIKENSYSSKLLDNALHHSAMSKLKNTTKRGRPDIAHICLLNALGSLLSKYGHLNLYLHTVNNEIYKINPEIKIARNYNRFKGLMAKLLIEDEIKTGKLVLISRIKKKLNALLKSLSNDEIILLSRKGKLVKDHLELFDRNLKKNYIVILGCFQKGSFSEEIMSLSNKIVSISNNSLDAWVVLNKVISYYEIANNIL